MGEAKEHSKKLVELSEKIMALGNSIRQAEKDMGSMWVDQIEMRDLQEVKTRMKAVEDLLCVLQEELGHIESRHCRDPKHIRK